MDSKINSMWPLTEKFAKINDNINGQLLELLVQHLWHAGPSTRHFHTHYSCNSQHFADQ